MTREQTTGQHGEALAVAYLQKKGYEIVARNWHCQYGEIDIVARGELGLVFIEVKTRHAATVNSALTAITAKKRDKLIKSAYSYISAHDLDDEHWRIDAIGIALNKQRKPIIAHVEDALDW